MPRREFRFEEGSSAKFWAIELNGKEFTVNWGRIGTSGQSQTKNFGSEAEAKKQYDKLVLEKTSKGYKEVGVPTEAPQPQAAPAPTPTPPPPLPERPARRLPISADSPIGPKLTALMDLIAKSKKVEFRAVLDLVDDNVYFEAATEPDGNFTAKFHLSSWESLKTPESTIIDCMLAWLNKFPQGTLRLDELICKVNDSYFSEASHVDIVADAWCELLNVDRAEFQKHQSNELKKIRDYWLDIWRLGPAGIEKWNEAPSLQRWQAGFDFSGVNLEGAKLDGLKVTRINFKGANFKGASLKGVNFADTGTLDDADLSGADLSGSKITYSFNRANLTRTNFTGADIIAAYFAGAKLDGTNFTRARLDSGDMSNADLSKATLEKTKLIDVSYNEGTIFPPGFVKPKSLDWMGDGPEPARNLDAKKPKKASSIKQCWTRIIAWHKKNAAEMKFTLAAGATAAEIDDFEKSVGITLPIDIRESLLLHNGAPTSSGLVNLGEILSLKAMLYQWKMYRDMQARGEYATSEKSWEPHELSPSDTAIKYEWWNLKRIPVTDNSGDGLMLDLDPAAEGTVGQIIKHGHEVGPEYLFASSWLECLQKIADDLEDGVYKYSKSHGGVMPCDELESDDTESEEDS